MQVVSQYTLEKLKQKNKTKPGPVSIQNRADFVWSIVEISCTDANHIYDKTVTESEKYHFYVFFVTRVDIILITIIIE